MFNSFCGALLVLINAVHLSHASSYSHSYDRNSGQQYQDADKSYLTNFGNGHNKHNFVRIEEGSDKTFISGTSYTNDDSGRPSVQKINVDINNPDHRGGSQGPDVHWNSKATRTQVTNIGNGVGNKNLFVINDERHDQSTPRHDQSNQGGYQSRTRYITNIGKGPDNDNQFYVNNKRVYPNAVNNNSDQNPSLNRGSIPPANSDVQNQQNQGWDFNRNINRPNGERKYGTGHQTPSLNGNTFPFQDESYLTNFGNGHNKHNFVRIEEGSDKTSISGTSYTNDDSGRPSVQKINVDINNPDHRGGSQGPDVHWNSKATRTQVTNIGNGVENKNLIVINDERHDQSTPRHDQSNQGGYQGRTRYITNIGKGPDNDNQFYVNNKRVYPNAVNNNGDQDPSLNRGSIPPANSDVQNQQNQGWDFNRNINRPNGERKYGTGHQTPSLNGNTNNHYNTNNLNLGKYFGSYYPENFNDPSLKVLHMRET